MRRVAFSVFFLGVLGGAALDASVTIEWSPGWWRYALLVIAPAMAVLVVAANEPRRKG